jgi:hypothetical protein
VLGLLLPISNRDHPSLVNGSDLALSSSPTRHTWQATFSRCSSLGVSPAEDRRRRPSSLHSGDHIKTSLMTNCATASAFPMQEATAVELAGPLRDLLPPVDFCCAYGSTLLHARSDKSSMVDYILGVADPAQWHSEVRPTQPNGPPWSITSMASPTPPNGTPRYDQPSLHPPLLSSSSSHSIKMFFCFL